MSNRKDKRLRQAVRKYELQLLNSAMKDIKSWPFMQRVRFAWMIVFPPKHEIKFQHKQRTD